MNPLPSARRFSDFVPWVLRSVTVAVVAVSAWSLCLGRLEAKEHDIVVEGSILKIDGITVTRTVPHKKDFATLISYDGVVRALGPNDRLTYGFKDPVLVWDALGITVLRDGEDEKDGQLLNLAVRTRKPDSPRDPDPKSLFAGSLTVNGIAINSATRLADIAPALEKQGFRIPNGARCYCLDKDGYQLAVAAGEDGLVHLFIFRGRYIVGRDERR